MTEAASPGAPQTLPERLTAIASATPGRPCYTFVSGRDSTEEHLTYGELHHQAGCLAAQVRAQGGGHDRAVLLYEPGLDFIIAFFACMYAGITAIPINPPLRRERSERFDAVVRDAGAGLVLTSGALRQRLGEVLLAPAAGAATGPALLCLETDVLLGQATAFMPAEAVPPDALALLQYTSGSTATPKGVMISHRNIMSNQRMIQACFEHDEHSVVVGWLPHYHDMGLIGNILQPVYSGCRCVLMSPLSFLQRPVRWLEAISKYGASTSGGPNFAYDLCARDIDDADCEGLDLSSWSLAFCGAERIHPDTLARFASKFKRYGFDPKSLYPCYGLAEATLMVTGGKKLAGPVVRHFDKARLEHNQAQALRFRRRDALALTGCGQAASPGQVLVVDPQTLEELADGQVGEIWIRGPNIAGGYWQRADENRAVFEATTASGQGPWFRSGDLGFLHKQELFVTGRLKELIIIRGQNIYPHDVEHHVVECDGDLRPLSCVAFALTVGTEEQLVILAESKKRRAQNAEELVQKIQRKVVEVYGVRPAHVQIVDPLRLPRTSSGKLQRLRCQQEFAQRQAAADAVPAQSPN